MKILGFGCSFIYGTDLTDPSDVWPSLIAKNIGIRYHCYSHGGSGNLQIMEAIMKFCGPDDIPIISWSWIDRFDFVRTCDEEWDTLRPSLDHKHAEYYYKNLHSQYRDMLTNLSYIKTAIDYLNDRNIKFLMTAMDDLLFENIHEQWHDPAPVRYLQNNIKPFVKNFEGLNFLNWSKKKGFRISDNWHPLEEAHAAAADYMMPVIESILRKA